METTLSKIEEIVGSKIDIYCYEGDYSITIKNGMVDVACFSLCELPGCCGICVSYHAEVFPNFSKKGLGKLTNLLRQQIAYYGGYSVLLCTDVVSNTPQQKILTNNGWTKNLEFTNRRTNNNVALHTIKLDEKLNDGVAADIITSNSIIYKHVRLHGNLFGDKS